MFRFEPDGFYATLRRRTIEHFEKKHGRPIRRSDVKAGHDWTITVLLSVVVFIFCQRWMCCGSVLPCWRSVAALLSGTSLGSLGFLVLHDGSHHAITTHKTTDRLLSSTIQGLLLLNHTLWTYHHVVRHHQYTGSVTQDPDTRHNMPFFRKSSKIEKNPIIGREWFPIKFLFFNAVFPGSCLGQGLSYHLVWVRRGRLWKMKLPDSFLISDKWQIFQYATSVCFIGIMCWFAGYHTIFHLMSINIVYFIGLSPDHDLFPSHLESEKFQSTDQHDWGEMQVRASANFCNSWYWYGRLMGGINYQIEHHLFPSVSNQLLPEISPIVRRTCKEFGIEYNHIDSPIEVWRNLLATYYDVFDNSANDKEAKRGSDASDPCDGKTKND